VRSRQGFSDVSRKTETALRAESLLYFNGRDEDRRLRIELGKARPAGRGQVEVPVRIDPSLRPGLTFMTMHFQDEVAVNLLTIDATDPKSGTAEFKATAIRIEKLNTPVEA
jgi:hypothetical protein